MTRYFGIFENGSYTEAATLQLIKDTPHVRYFFRRDFDSINYAFNQHNQFKYTPVDASGKFKSIRIGDFELIDIGPEHRTANYCRRYLSIRNNRTSEIHQESSNESGIDFVHNDLLPLLNSLNKYGSWEMYQYSFEIDNLKKENESLKRQLRSLRGV